MTKIKLLPLFFLLYLQSIIYAMSEDEEEQQKWYDYNSLFIRYGYRMTGNGKINRFGNWDTSRIQMTIEDYMQGRGIFFHPSRLWKTKDANTSGIQYMYNSRYPPNTTLFEYAKSEIEDNTCIHFTEIKETVHKHCRTEGETEFICVYGGEGTCAAEYGQNLTKPTLFSVTSKCGKRGALREMGHILGLQNTQARSDRSKYLHIAYRNLRYTPHDEIFKKAILAEQQLCTDTSLDKQEMPYDFASVMQTGILQQSEDNQLVLVPDDPRHLYMIDYAQNYYPHFSHYDLWAINNIYKCSEKFAKKCAAKKCENFGYLTRNCTCICPKGTSGKTCASPSFSTNVYDIPETPACYKLVTAKNDSFTLKEIGLVKAKEEPFTQHCVIVVNSPSCQLPLITFDTDTATQALKPKVKLWLENEVSSCSSFSLFYNVSGIHTRNICWDQLYDGSFYEILSRRSSVWFFVRMEDIEIPEIVSKIRIHVRTLGDFRCTLDRDSIFDEGNSKRMRSVGGDETTTIMGITLPVLAVCILAVLGLLYWKCIRVPGPPGGEDAADEEAEEHGEPDDSDSATDQLPEEGTEPLPPE